MQRSTVKNVVPLLVMLALACASKGVQPETQIAHYEVSVLGAATELQKAITTSTDAKILPVSVAQELTSYVEKFYAKSGELNTALKLYHAATTLDVRALQAAACQRTLGEMNALLSQILGVKIPPGVTTQIIALTGNVISAIGAVQSEIAKGLRK